MDKEQEEYIQIGLEILKRFNKPLRFDIYVLRAQSGEVKKYTKIFQRGDLLDWDRVEMYKGKGLKHFYVIARDYTIYSVYLEKLGEFFSNGVGKLGERESLNLLRELVSFTMHEIISNQKVNERVVKNAGHVVDGCIKTLSENKGALAKVLKLMSNQTYIVKHSVAVSLFSVMLGKQSGIESNKTLNTLGLGAFLHDVGVGQLTFDPEDCEILTPEQRKEVWRHPELAKQQLDGIKGIGTDILQIVMQHHEQPNGHGYPNGLREGEIFPLAKIVAIADCFAAMISKKAYRDAFTVGEALSAMSEGRGKYDTQLLRSFCEIFSNYKEQKEKQSA